MFLSSLTKSNFFHILVLFNDGRTEQHFIFHFCRSFDLRLVFINSTSDTFINNLLWCRIRFLLSYKDIKFEYFEDRSAQHIIQWTLVLTNLIITSFWLQRTNFVHFSVQTHVYYINQPAYSEFCLLQTNLALPSCSL